VWGRRGAPSLSLPRWRRHPLLRWSVPPRLRPWDPCVLLGALRLPVSPLRSSTAPGINHPAPGCVTPSATASVGVWAGPPPASVAGEESSLASLWNLGIGPREGCPGFPGCPESVLLVEARSIQAFRSLAVFLPEHVGCLRGAEPAEGMGRAHTSPWSGYMELPRGRVPRGGVPRGGCHVEGCHVEHLPRGSCTRGQLALNRSGSCVQRRSEDTPQLPSSFPANPAPSSLSA